MKVLKKILKYVLWSIFIFTILVVALTYWAFIYVPDQCFSKAEKQAPYDVIIVPGVPFKDKWSDIMRSRVLWADYLFKKGLTKNIIFSGSAVYSPYYEGKIMALYGRSMGIPAENIFEEIKAEHSTENLYYSYQIAKSKGFKRIALATDPFQNLMLWRFKNEVDPAIERIPIVFKIVKNIPKKEVHIDPTSAKSDYFISLVKRESFWERFKGTLGRKIKK
jgi:uncharacterized SAM-binding protein YcdF (DUF218 family)